MKTILAIFGMLLAGMLLLGCTSQDAAQDGQSQVQQQPGTQQPSGQMTDGTAQAVSPEEVVLPDDITDDARLNDSIAQIYEVDAAASG